jgi:putative transposase
MPRQARIDALGALHHLIIRGIDRTDIFLDERDRENFLERLGAYGGAPVFMRFY